MGKSHQVNIRVEEKILDKFKKIAENNGQTVSSRIRLLMAEDVKEAGK